ncbi:hypothetical protein CGRA01v4_14082 [Colletotrichum graminicola]|uniref:BTB domain-containing protein n=1 Tax=Colletotrichum graminicola (strain M1.001 / M2 / FGSC 10212) TaxID=645133 RepID=E3QUV6_COLGM|nr:uncharacterized protein GLRG_09788 [Colletotrichum graminicola M1.001]EFQ34644.1 hypothetical protein GLRG_09788 [Colletotrichum graminicola M1.001]WDK22792.1 hypothetical protein CGRA01v4_14082 [Colletotrichum graminicola]
MVNKKKKAMRKAPKKAMSYAPEKDEPVAIADVADGEPKVLIPDAIDDGPEISPYKSPTCSVYFQDGEAFTVPRDILCVSDELREIFKNSNEFFIGDVPAEAGHVLLHYLHTHTWQTLRKRSSLHDSRTSAQFETSVYVYAAAQTYGLPGLAELAKENIPRYANELSALDIIVLAGKPCERLPEDDPWFLAFIDKQMEQLFADSASLNKPVFLECFKGASSEYSRILGKSMFSICYQKLASAKSAEAQAVPMVDEALELETKAAFEAPSPASRVTPCGDTIPWVPLEERAVEVEPEARPLSLREMYEKRKRFLSSCIAAVMDEADGGQPALNRSSAATHVGNSKWEHCSCSMNADDSSTRCGSSAANTPSSGSEAWWPHPASRKRYT